MELEADHYDVVVLGTGLAESLAAASLANSGKSVLHLDPNEYYGAEQASLTLDELSSWASARSPESESENQDEAGPSRPFNYISAQRRRYTHISTTPLTPELQAAKRQYAISLFPSVLPSRGKLIETLIDSKVSNYVGFRILDSVSIWQPPDHDDGGGRDADKEGGREAKTKRVPGSKEEVFKDKSIDLVEKRRLMKFLMFVAGEFEDDELLKGKEKLPLPTFLSEAFSLPDRLCRQITYAISHCTTPREPTLPALHRTRRYLRSIGRYGPSAFLVGQYGGAGEIAQGFCRACAVKGGTYVLGPQAEIESLGITNNESDSASRDKRISMKIACHPRPISAKHLISTADHLPPSLLSTLETSQDGSTGDITSAHGIAVLASFPEILKRSRASNEDEGEKPEAEDTAVIIFPPEEGRALVRGLIMGEGTGSCPAGQYILYLSTTISAESDPRDILRPYMKRLASDPLFEAYYLSHRSQQSSSTTPGSVNSSYPVVLLQQYAGEEMLTEGLDWEAEAGEKAYWAVMGDKDSLGEGVKGWWEKDVEDGAEGEEGDQEL